MRSSPPRVAHDVPTEVPDSLAAGETWRWTVSFADHPASGGGTLTYYLRGAGTVDATAVADGDAWDVTVAAGTTATVAAGVYSYVARHTDADGVVTTLDEGTVTVTANLATAVAGDLQLHEERAIAALEAKLEARYAADTSAYTIHQRQLQREEIADLERILAQKRAALARLKNGGRLAPITFAFARPR